MNKTNVVNGVKCFSISGRMAEERQRCLGMTEEERRWRAQWLKDQVLTHDEPRYVPEYYKETNNIFRRLWKTPMNKFQELLEPSLGPNGAFIVRHGTKILFMGISLVYIGAYFLKYHSNNFIYSGGVELIRGSETMYPHHPDYPNYLVAKKPSDYYDQGFYSSVLCQDVVVIEEDIPPPPPPPPPSLLPPELLDELCPGLANEE